MDWKPVESSHVHSVGYDLENKQVHVKYKSGGIYIFHGVEQDAFDNLHSAESIGKHLNTVFKKNYRHNPLE